MTTGKQILDVLKDVPKFGGLYFYDQLNDIKALGDECIVINYVTTKEALDGVFGHYVALDNRYMIKNDSTVSLYYFDPYGLEPDIGRDIMRLPNTGNMMKLIQRTSPVWKYNEHQYQVFSSFDLLCAVYSCLYVLDPNFKTNAVFYPGQDRYKLDWKMEKTFEKLGFIKKND